ncbi:mechanosensitive ion channel family protein [Fluoribacter gormanii]|uniref:Small-conductance mechanosensitive channel n=1 Tax=Fluoribacter gormanii TaxID=464 RepID=A0A377GLI6_9GAMM|nr:mechanosensitive ion channel family protein [Fluoribacter gormanii]KTD05002.1 mechanosensitive ion channel MscS [Fluoribacter gormanii]SIR55760.1 Small-conductance mechanosensitive channel [Fluoribacter gormanii]STO25631.1 Small-conductance mechanosensitive channel [Fluoribacter gormanii]
MNNTFEYLKHINWEHIAFALLLLFLGYFLAKKISHWVEKLIENRFSKHLAILSSRVIYYGLFLLFSISALHEMGFKLTLLLGTAGLFTVALSFASQTAASNLISGVFLLFERPFKVGDVISIKDIKGTVETIDWLSTKIKTSDNRLIRIPNEGLIKSEITNLSIYPQKRDEIILRIDAVHDVNNIKSLLYKICEECSHILPTPKPQILLSQMIDRGGVELKVLYWSKSDLATVRDEVLSAIKITFEREAITFVNERIYIPTLPSSITPLPL